IARTLERDRTRRMAHKTLEYRDGAVTLKGFLADDGGSGARPGVVLFPEATGVGDHVMERARRLAALGYVALAADPYGDGQQAKDLPHAIELMTAVRSDVNRWRARAKAALDALNIRAKVLVCHGASDPLNPLEHVAAFEAEMRKTMVDWQLCTYGGAVHSFTNPDADKLGNPAFAYNASADRRSWAQMLSLFEEAFSSR